MPATETTGARGPTLKSVKMDVDTVRKQVEQLLTSLPSSREETPEEREAALAGMMDGMGVQVEELRRTVDTVLEQQANTGLNINQLVAKMGEQNEAFKKALDELGDGLADGMAMFATKNDLKDMAGGMSTYVREYVDKTAAELMQDHRKNAPLTSQAYRKYREGVEKVAPESKFWRGAIYVATGIAVLALLGEVIGYATGTDWCRPSSLWREKAVG